MELTRLHQFGSGSQVSLPCESAYYPAAGVDGEPLAIRRSDRPLDECSHVRLLARRYGGQLRAYDLGDGVLACMVGLVVPALYTPHASYVGQPDVLGALQRLTTADERMGDRLGKSK